MEPVASKPSLPKVSVAIPLYNAAPYIEDCLNSVVSQETQYSFEIVVSDDASTDGSFEIVESFCASYPGLISIFRHNNNLGMVKNVAWLALQCRGDYVVPLDADDRMMPGRIQVLIDFLEREPDCVMAFHELRAFDSVSGKTKYYFHRNYYNHSKIPSRSSIEHLVRYGNYFLPSSIAYRRSSIPANGFYTQVKLVEDLARNIQIAACGYIGRIDQVLGEYRIHPDSATQRTRRSVERRLQVLNDQLRSIELAAEYGVSSHVISFGKANAYLAAAMFLLRAGEYSYFRDVLERGVGSVGFCGAKHRLLYCLRRFPFVARKWFFLYE